MVGADDAAVALRRRLARLRMSATPDQQVAASGPATIYEAVTRQMVEALTEDLREIKGRLNGLLWMTAGAILVDVALRLSHGG